MHKTKRLFLFAGFEAKGIMNDALIYYVSALSKHGDVILCMDCDCKKSEIKKIKDYTIHTITKKHGEYDFGSYKRCFQYAQDKKILQNYKYIYLINDSVFGPLFDIKDTLNRLEQKNNDACGIIISKHKTHSYIESWFIRLNKKIFLSSWFDTFISSIQKENKKTTITVKYEHGLTNIIKNNNCSYGALYTVHGRYTYNHPKNLFKRGCPFIKKACFTRHDGACGKQIKYILHHCDRLAAEAIIKTASYLYGEQYINHFLTYNPLTILYRNIRYAIYKIGKK